jgi:hypothetical protein
MFKIKFLRNIVLMSMALAIALPIYNVFIAYPAFMKSLMEDKKAEAARIATHLKNILVTREAGPDGGPPLVDAEAVDVMRGDFDLVKIKVFSADGKVVYSTDPGDVGEVNEGGYFHEIVADGHSRIELVDRQERSLEGQVMASDVVEAYIPITEGGRVLGAFEIYYDITAVKGRYEDSWPALPPSSSSWPWGWWRPCL